MRQVVRGVRRRFRAACRDYRRRQEFITPDTPEQNGMIERFFRSLKEGCVWQHQFPSVAAADRAALNLGRGLCDQREAGKALGNIAVP